MALQKKWNLGQHFKMVNKHYENDLPAKTALHSQKVGELKGQLAAQQSVFTSTLRLASTLQPAPTALLMKS